MKTKFIGAVVVFYFLLAGCGKKQEPGADFNINDPRSTDTTMSSDKEKASTRIDLDNKGVGAITSVVLDETIDQDLANSGKVLFDQKCIVCHKVGEEFIGPAPNGVLDRRTPEWIMNMILNPELMLKEDPLAKDLFMEFNGAPMTNMGLSEDEARAILEYFRTLE